MLRALSVEKRGRAHRTHRYATTVVTGWREARERLITQTLRGRTIMKRLKVLVTGILVVGVYACSRDDGVSTTRTNSAAIPMERVAADVYRPSHELDLPDSVTTTSLPSAAPTTAAAAPATTARASKPAGSKPAGNEDPEPLTAPVGPGGFVPGPLDTGRGFVPGPLDTARGFGPARVNPARNFAPAPLDTSFRGPGVVDNRPTGGPMRPSGASNPNTTSGADQGR